MSFRETNIAAQQLDQRSPRKRQLIRAVLIASDQQSRDVVIRNVSEQGLGGIAIGLPLIVGESAKIIITDEATVEGTIVWVDGENFGMRLWNELDLEALTELIRRKQALERSEREWEVRRIHKSISVQAPRAPLRTV